MELEKVREYISIPATRSRPVRQIERRVNSRRVCTKLESLWLLVRLRVLNLVERSPRNRNPMALIDIILRIIWTLVDKKQNSVSGTCWSNDMPFQVDNVEICSWSRIHGVRLMVAVTSKSTHPPDSTVGLSSHQA